jgi:prephenate dehydrogenase
MRGIRGAICADDNTRDSIYRATQALLRELMKRNGLRTEDILAAFFTMTPDLNADFPAYAARELGWVRVPMLGAQESLVPGAPQRAIRVLVLAEGEGDSRAAYLGRAAAMRPDLAEPGDPSWDEERPETHLGKAEQARGLLVVGLGLIGGSVAAGARRSGLYAAVRGYDRDPKNAAMALERGLVDGVAVDLEADAARADMIVLATPVSAILRLIEDLGRHLRPGAVVTDVGSTKRGIVEALGNLPGGIGAVGGHPMAGSTASGAAAANPDLFKGARWAVVECARTDADALTAVEALVRSLGARPVRMRAEDHDRMVAMTSHLPALVAAALVETVGVAGPTGGDEWLVGPGFLSTSRLAGGDPEMTSQMLADNADYLEEAVEAFVARLQECARTATGDPLTLAGRLAEARDLRQVLTRPAAD